jgi:hypothetical protein
VHACRALSEKLTPGRQTIGVAYTDPTTREIGISQFHDTDQCSNLEARFLIEAYLTRVQAHCESRLC